MCLSTPHPDILIHTSCAVGGMPLGFNKDYLCKISILLIFYRFRQEYGLQGTIIVYLSPDVAKKISFYFWEFTSTRGICIQCIPPNLFEMIVKANLSVFTKLKPSVLRTVWK